MKVPRHVYHVIPHPDRGWCVKRSGASRASRIGFEVRADACIWAWGRSAVDEVVVHKPDGSVDWIERMPDDCDDNA